MTTSSTGWGRWLSISFAGFLALALFTGCSGLFNGHLFKERASETPAPDDISTDKSFFVDSSGKPKTFLCAWAPEIGQGWMGEEWLQPYVNGASHCNVEFEITETALVAKIINPSFLNDRNRWKEMIEIPITKHYYYERDKDQYGRDTNVWIENDKRSHWSARPKMKLDLANIKVLNLCDEIPCFGQRTISVEDIEWDNANNFLGFSVNMQLTPPNLIDAVASAGGQATSGTEFQAKFRFNFLKFDHDPTFKPTPYNEENAKYMNILHVVGHRVDGIANEMFAGHWDLRQPTRVYISGAPAEVQKGLVNAIYLWDKELQNIGAVPKGQNPFLPVIKDLAHPFDLRYPSITWIEDRRISMFGPLGIGMAHADVRNGKIMWGGVVLFGGMLENYINEYAPTESDASVTSAMLNPAQALTSLFPSSFPAMKALDPANKLNLDPIASAVSLNQRNFMTDELARLGQSKLPADQSKAATLRAQLANSNGRDPQLAKVMADMEYTLAGENSKVTEYFKHMTISQLLGTAGDGKPLPGLADMEKRQGRADMANIFSEKDPKKRAHLLQSYRKAASPFFIEDDLTIANLGPSWMASNAKKTRTYPEMLDSVVASLIIHEWGHVLGLGHQFKENIVPDEGTVPSHFIKELSEKATPEREFSNFTSVMGYQSGRTEMMTPANEYVPGPHDDLVLRYLYNGEYTAYDKARDEFAYYPVPAGGKIPAATSTINGAFPTAYFPQCNDFEASLGADPFCNRWDRGSSAVDIVNSYFELLNDNLLSSLYSVVKGGGSPQEAENRLFGRALDTFSRVRLFYDEMRRRLRSDANLKAAWDGVRNDKDALMEFSNACAKDDPTTANSPALRQIFADKKMVDLCRANAIALKEFSFFLNLPESDYTRIDHNNHYVLGGYLAGDAISNGGHAFGSWYEMSNLPLKFSALYTLATADPFMLYDGELIPDFFYYNEENRFLYRTLYPVEYTRLISNTVQNNMRFAATGRDDTTTMGRAVLMVGSLLPWQSFTSNDSERLPREYNLQLDQQTQFNFSVVAVLISAIKPDAASNVKADHYKKFTAKVYDLITGKEKQAREVFLLPNGEVIVWANGMFIYPMTKVKFYDGTNSYVLAYKVDYDEGPRDDLAQDGLKRALLEKHNEIVSYCVDGFDGNGLLNWFDPSNQSDGKAQNPQAAQDVSGTGTTSFEGFQILDGIALETSSEKLGVFYDSLNAEFDKYERSADQKIPPTFPIKSMRRICDEAMRGIGQISAAAAMVNGQWLGITPDYLEK